VPINELVIRYMTIVNLFTLYLIDLQKATINRIVNDDTELPPTKKYNEKM